jgi:hypothetical protein
MALTRSIDELDSNPNTVDRNGVDGRVKDSE